MRVIAIGLDLVLQFLFPILPTTQRLLQWTVSSTILIVLVLALRLVLKDKVSCRVRYALWTAVLIRLLLPMQLPFALPASPAQSVPEIPAAWEAPVVPIAPSQYPIEEAHPYHQQLEPGYLGPSAWSQGYVERSEDGETMTSYWDMYSINQVIQCVWLGGFLLTALILLVSNLRFRIKLEDSRTLLDVSDCPLSVYVTQGLPSPCLVGLNRPDIYLTPQTAQNETVRRHVLAHELTHYAHKDHIWSFLRCLCLALHWYNPLVWLAVHISKRDGELACDEGAVARLGEDQRLSYGRTLVDIVAQRPARPADLLSCSTTMTEGKKTIQQRIQLLVKHPETRKTALFFAMAVLALAAVFAFAGRSEDTDYYAQFQKDLASAQSVWVRQPTISSLATPYPITDSALLKQAVEKLDDARDLLTPVEEDLSNAVLFASSVTLTDGTGRESVYYLYEVNGACYAGLFTDLGEWPDGTFTPFAKLPREVISQLNEIARQQGEFLGNTSPTLSGPGLSAEGMTFRCDSDDFSDVAAVFGEALVQAYLDQPADRISAVTSARLQSFTITDYIEGDNNQFCVQVDLAVIPVEFNNIYWAAGAGIDAMEGDEWRHTLFYRLVRESTDRWRCDEAGTHMALDLKYSTVYSVTFPEFKARLTELFLNDPQMVALNNPAPEQEAEMREWLTNWTSAYEICYGLPWWGAPGETEAGWFGRAIDAGSWFFLRIPDHLVEPVLAVCQEQTEYLPLSFLDLTQYAEVTCSDGTGTPVTIPALQATVLLDLLQMPYIPGIPARIDMNNRDAVITLERDGMISGYLNLQETEQGCLYAIYLPRHAPDTIAAEGILPTGTVRELVDTFHLLADGPDYSTMSTQETISALRPSDILQIYYSGAPWDQVPDHTWLVRALQNAHGTPIDTELNPGMAEAMDHHLWSMDLHLTHGCELTLRAGRAENEVIATLNHRLPDGSQKLYEPQLLLQDATLYALFRSAPFSDQAIQVNDPAVLALMEQVLEEELDFYRSLDTRPGKAEAFLDVRLTSLEHLISLNDQLHVYLYDFGFVMDDLVNAPWAGGPYVDGNLLYHPGGGYYHLITREENGQILDYTFQRNEFPLSVSHYREVHGDDAFPALQAELERLLEMDN